MERFTADNARASQRENFTQLYEIYELIKKEVEKENNPHRHLDIHVTSHDYYEENNEKWEYITSELKKDGYFVCYNRYQYQYRICWE